MSEASSKPMSILVTGGSGFIGTNLVSDLLAQGHRVRIYDKRPSEKYPRLCTIGDVCDKDTLVETMRGVDAVYHLAAEHRDDVRPTSLYYEVNVGGSENVVYALTKNDINKAIYTSTVAVYGLNSNEPSEDSALKPFNAYGQSKYESEKVFNTWAEARKNRCLVTVRPTVIFGEKNRGNVYNLIAQIASRKFVMVGRGKNKKSMGYVRNLSKFLESLLTIESGMHLYNYADKPDLSMEELVNIVLDALGKNDSINFRIPYAFGLLGGYTFDVMSTITKKTYPTSAIRIKKFCADTVISSKKLEETGFVAPYSLVDGLNRMISSDFSISADQADLF